VTIAGVTPRGIPRVSVAAWRARRALTRRRACLAARPTITTIDAEDAGVARVENHPTTTAECRTFPLVHNRSTHSIAEKSAAEVVKRADGPRPFWILLMVDTVDDNTNVMDTIASLLGIVITLVEAIDHGDRSGWWW